MPSEFTPNINGTALTRQALTRFYALEKRLRKNKNLKEQLHERIEDLIKDEVWEKVGSFEEHKAMFEGIQEQGKERIILPMQLVVDQQKTSTTGSLRCCLDATQANKLLHRGVMELKPLAPLLMKWRYYQYYVSLDIKSMFWQIDMRPEDRELAHTIFRYQEDQPWTLYRHRRIVMGQVDAQSNAIQCLNKAAELEKEKYPEVEATIRDNTYADDIEIYGWDMEGVVKNAKDVSLVAGKYNFPCRKLITDNFSVLKAFEKDVISPKLHDVWDGSVDADSIDMVLGDTEGTWEHPVFGKQCIYFSDLKQLGVRYKIDFKNNRSYMCYSHWSKGLQYPMQTLSKRDISRRVASAWQPLGEMLPLTGFGKLALSLVWRLSKYLHQILAAKRVDLLLKKEPKSPQKSRLVAEGLESV